MSPRTSEIATAIVRLCFLSLNAFTIDPRGLSLLLKRSCTSGEFKLSMYSRTRELVALLAGSLGGLAHLCTTTEKAAPSFAVFERWGLRTRAPGDPSLDLTRNSRHPRVLL
jgi:hypothetical protein